MDTLPCLPAWLEVYHLPIHAALVDYVPYSFFCYFGLLTVSWVIRQVWLFLNPQLTQQSIELEQKNLQTQGEEKKIAEGGAGLRERKPNKSGKDDKSGVAENKEGETKKPRPPAPPMMVNHTIQYWHNMFLVVQSLGLIFICFELYRQTAIMSDQMNNRTGNEKLRLVLDFPTILVKEIDARVQAPIFKLTMTCFLLNKIYEALDTVILVLNGKDLLGLHVWHHATTFVAFFQGCFTGACMWIGVLNSAIHVVMYLYYAKVSWIVSIAKWITSMQIFHLFGGAITNGSTYFNNPIAASDKVLQYTIAPISVLKGSGVERYFPTTVLTSLIPTNLQSGFTSFFTALKSDLLGYSAYSTSDASMFALRPTNIAAVNGFICFSYFFLFLAFFSKKYHKNGNIWKLFGIPNAIPQIFRSILPGGIVEYAKKQGLL